MNKRNWDNYYKITKKNTQPKTTLLKAMELSQCGNKSAHTKLAIDLGCGAGSDSIELLKHDWFVLAIDSQAEAISTLLSLCPQSLQKRLRTKVSPFEAISALPIAQLINASYSLPFLSSDNFYKFWQLILKALDPGSCFAGTFLGINDSWSHNQSSGMTFLDEKDLYNLFAPFEMKLFEEEESDEADAMGFMKYWHKYFVVAEKC